MHILYNLMNFTPTLLLLLLQTKGETLSQTSHEDVAIWRKSVCTTPIHVGSDRIVVINVRALLTL